MSKPTFQAKNRILARKIVKCGRFFFLTGLINISWFHVLKVSHEQQRR